jgi:predicted MPP superfamily phosphohydrolase
MSRAARMLLFSTSAVFIALLAPLATLLAWLFTLPVHYCLLVAWLASLPVVMLMWRSIEHSHNAKQKWFWMQALGLGAVLLPLVLLGTVLTFFFSSRAIGIAILCTWPLLALFSVRQAHNIKNRRIRFHAPQLTSNMRVVQISDVHIGSRSADFLHKVIDQVTAHDPDLLLVTGDLLDSSSVKAEDLTAFNKLTCPSYMCIGNHERYVDLKQAIAAIESNGVVVLREEAVQLDQLQIIGLDDRDIPDDLPKALNTIPADPTHFRILMYHRPDGWHAAIDQQIDLTLSGHTHAGQMWPFGYLVKKQYPNMAGLFKRGKYAMFVSTGAGTWGPIFRLGTQSEITVIELDAATANR